MMKQAILVLATGMLFAVTEVHAAIYLICNSNNVASCVETVPGSDGLMHLITLNYAGRCWFGPWMTEIDVLPRAGGNEATPNDEFDWRFIQALNTFEKQDESEVVGGCPMDELVERIESGSIEVARIDPRYLSDQARTMLGVKGSSVFDKVSGLEVLENPVLQKALKLRFESDKRQMVSVEVVELANGNRSVSTHMAGRGENQLTLTMDDQVSGHAIVLIRNQNDTQMETEFIIID